MRAMQSVFWYKILFLVISGLTLVRSAAYGGKALPKTESTIEKVALFKNGLSFFTTTARCPANVATLTLGQLPVPVFGTFWVVYPESLKVKRLITAMETIEEPVEAQSIAQLLGANPDRKAKLFFGNGPNDVLEGILIGTASDSDLPGAANPYFMDFRGTSPDQRSFGGGYPSQPGLLMVKTEKGLVAFNPGSITRAALEGETPVAKVSQRRKRPSIRLETEPSAKAEELTISYLAKGITWVPGYLIDLSDPATATLSAGAQIINEVCDLDQVALDLITGFPNIRFGEIVHPVAMSQNLADFLASLASGRTDSGRGFRNGMAQQALVMQNMVVGQESDRGSIPTYSTPTEGTVSEDLFLYPIKDFSLKKGESAWVPLFVVKVPYQHLYTWKIGDYLDESERCQQNSRRQEETPGEEVWHSCRLTNAMKMPLTTAATEFMVDGRFVGQDMCFYTAPGARTTIKINKAMNVLAEEAEFETSRTRNAAQFYGSSFDLVSVRGQLKVRNRMDKPVKVEIIKELSGEVQKRDPEGQDIQTAKGLKKVNPKHSLIWEIEVAPSEEKALTYEYQVYIRN